MSALSAGVKDVRAVIETARRQRRSGGPPTVLFIDEVHRFSKTQQDSLLAAVEDRTVTLLAATTENPYFSVISPLLSRCVLLTLQPLDDEAVRGLLRRAVADERGLAGAVTLAADAEDHLVRLAGGDVRKALTALEAAAGLRDGRSAATRIDLATAEQAVDVAALRYDRDGDAHYDVVSAFIKSMRGSDVDAALHWLARMLVAGEDARFIARRMVIFASEDVGMADPAALSVATAAAHAVEYVGLPEAQLNLAQAVIHLATAPKSNAVTTAIGAAIADVRAGRGGAVPRGAARRALLRRPRARPRRPATATRTTTRAAWSPSSTPRTTWSGTDYYQPSRARRRAFGGQPAAAAAPDRAWSAGPGRPPGDADIRAVRNGADRASAIPGGRPSDDGHGCPRHDAGQRHRRRRRGSTVRSRGGDRPDDGPGRAARSPRQDPPLGSRAGRLSPSRRSRSPARSSAGSTTCARPRSNAPSWARTAHRRSRTGPAGACRRQTRPGRRHSPPPVRRRAGRRARQCAGVLGAAGPAPG